MTHRKIIYCSGMSVTPSQPGTSVSYRSSGGFTGVTLCVSRHYDQLPNSFGGKGVTKRLDGYGLVFPNIGEAQAFAVERGYVVAFHTTESGRRSRSSHKARAMTARAVNRAMGKGVMA